jgi:hypothetical protein
VDDSEVDGEAGGVVDEVLAISALGTAFADGGGWAAAIRFSRVAPSAESWMLTAVTRTVSSRPVVSITTLRLRPTIFYPRGRLRGAALVFVHPAPEQGVELLEDSPSPSGRSPLHTPHDLQVSCLSRPCMTVRGFPGSSSPL